MSKKEASVLIDTRSMGIDQVVSAMEAAYQKSCEFNHVSPNDLEYFRSYVWVTFALVLKQEEKNG